MSSFGGSDAFAREKVHEGDEKIGNEKKEESMEQLHAKERKELQAGRRNEKETQWKGKVAREREREGEREREREKRKIRRTMGTREMNTRRGRWRRRNIRRRGRNYRRQKEKGQKIKRRTNEERKRWVREGNRDSIECDCEDCCCAERKAGSESMQ